MSIHGTAKKTKERRVSYKSIVKSPTVSIRQIVPLLLLTGAMLVGLGWYTYRSYERFIIAESQKFRITKLSGVITHLNEVLTMSARMAAATGDLQWQQRYQGFEPRLNTAIKEAIALAPKSFMAESMARTDAANIKLVTMEHKSFDLVRQGKRKASSELLYSQDYEEQKHIYSQGVTQFMRSAQKHIKERLAAYRRMALGAIAFICFIVPLSLFAWFAVLQMHRDIVRRKQIGEILDRKQKNLEAIFDAAPVGMLLLDENMIIKRANDVLKQMVRKEYSQIINHRYGQALGCINISYGDKDCGRSADCEGCPLRSVIESVLHSEEPVHQVEFQPVLKVDTREIMPWLSVSVEPVMIEGHKHMVVALDDITERKNAENVVKESELKFKTIFENAGGAIFIADLKTGKILECNSLAEKLLGRSRAEIIGMHQSKLHPEEEERKYKEKFAAHIRKGHLVDYEGEVQHADGSRIPVWIAAQTMEVGNKDQIIELFVDITEGKKAEEALKQANEQLIAAAERSNKLAQEATAADVAKGQFLANMSHEIRTPMNAIIGFSGVLADENLTKEQKHHVDTIQESAQSLLHLIDDILNISKMDVGKFSIEITDCLLGQMFAVVNSMMRPQAIERGLRFDILQCGPLPAKIHTDPVRLRQCLVNLITNAIKFTERGHVYVNVFLEQPGDKAQAKAGESEEKMSEWYICFDVEDTGIGIPADKQEKIFESFTQADGSTTRSYGGTGLGLAITKRLAHLLGGEVSLTSELGKGSVFSLKIPVGVDIKSEPMFDKYKLINELDSKLEPYEYLEQYKFAGRVLVAEDTKTSQELLKMLLKRLGLEVTIAEDGREAVDKALSHPFDLILMDIQMPHLNGYEATKILRSNGLKTAIVAVTAYAMKGDDEKCIAAGCSDYVAKPIDSKILLQVIRKYLPCVSDEMSKNIDAVRSQVDKLNELCSEQIPLGAQSAESVSRQSSEIVINWGELINRVDDEELIYEIMSVFVTDNRKQLSVLAAAVKKADEKDVKLHAHSLKGSAANVGAERLSEMAYSLEQMASEGDLSGAEGLLQKIRTEFEKVGSFVSQPNWIELAKQQQNQQIKQV